jgi:hypothetical protein
MPFIKERGSPTAKIWIILERPYGSDIPKGVLLSGGMGSVYAKMLREAGLELDDCYVCCRRPNTDADNAFAIFDGPFSQYQPPFILAVNEVGTSYLPELCIKGDKDVWRGQLQKNAGSLLTSANIAHPHYMMPVYGPDRAVSDWQERNVTTYVDFQKLRDELQYYRKHGALQPLPERKLVYGDLDCDDILQRLDAFKNSELISVDIETVYPREKSAFHPHPGYPVTVGLADSANFGISFNLFRDNPKENRAIWRALDSILRKVRVLGQNFFNFDALFFESLGFKIELIKVQDTLIRHHILWPELSHKLQFMTRQYTREPYYKDEGHGWSVKNMDKLRRYNCLDVCVTYEIYEQQEEEFKQRPHLR